MYNELLLSEGGGIISQSSVSKQMGSACVMIGIGGTGLAALRRVKKEVYLHLEPDDPDAAVPEYSKIAFLGIDTDTTDLTVVNPDITDLQAHEQWSVNVPRLGEMLANPENKTDPCLNWLSIPLEMDGDQGAGGNRQAGRFCLFKKAPALRIKLREIINQVKTKAGLPNVQVHIFAGISGGTGSGCFLDVCYILRDILKGTGSTVCGYFFLPDTQLYRPGIQSITAIENYNKRNGYAALRDLDYCMSFPSSGGCFRENYSLDFSVESKEAPVDLCHLISVTDTTGVTKENGFNYSLSVVAEYVLTYLADVQATSVQKANDTKGLTIEGFRINIRQALGTIRPNVGAERNYNIVGASSAELPLTHIGTYLASVTYSKMQDSLQRHSSKLICDNFAKKIRCTTNGLIARLAFGVNPNIGFNPDPEKLAQLNENDNWDVIPESLQHPILRCKTAALGKIQENFTTESRDIDSYDMAINAQISQPTFMLTVFNELTRMCSNPAEGPTMAAEILHGDGIDDFRSVLKAIEKEVETLESNYKANVPLRKQAIKTAAHNYNRAVVGWKKKLELYQKAWSDYIRNEINIELLSKLKSLIPTLHRQLDTLYRNYFSPLRNLIFELGDTFATDLTWLESPAHTSDESFCWRIFEYDDVKEELDSTILKSQDIAIEHQNFIDYLIQHYREWSANNTYRAARCVNEYMVQRFSATLNTTVDNFLMSAYNVTNLNQLPDKIRAELLNKVSVKASPLFWKTARFDVDDSTTVSNNVLSIPMGSTAINTASIQFASSNGNVIIRPSALGDRVSCLRFVSGIPLHAYQGLENLKGPYYAAIKSSSKGLHLHERDVNWTQTLPSAIPYSVAVKNNIAQERDIKASELFDRAVSEHIICSKSEAYPDDFVVRILPNTEKAVSTYQKEKYYFAGKLNRGDLEHDIANLKIYRESLLPATVSEDESLPLLNDGYPGTEKNPELDMREVVRRDYFVRFIPLQTVAEESLKQLQRIDDKLAEMEAWKSEESEQSKRVKRYLMLCEMGYIANDSSVAQDIILNYTYRGVAMSIPVCDRNSEYAFATDYQAFISIDSIDEKQLVALDAELAEKYKVPKPEWRDAVGKLIASITDDKIAKLQTRYQNDANRDAIAAFYRDLRSLAYDELELLPVAASEPVAAAKVEKAPESAKTVSDIAQEVIQPAAGQWKCPSCGTMNDAEDAWCGECGAEKAEPVSEPTSWTCRNGHDVPWKRKFCGKCGPRGGIRPWICPKCKTMNDADDAWCGECGAEKA